MIKTELFGQNIEVEFDEKDIFATDEYEQNVLVDGMWIAFDEAVCDWVQLGTEDQYYQEHTTTYQF